MNGPEFEEFIRLSARVKALNQIEETLLQEVDGVPRYLMQLDPSGPNILAAVSQNNPDDADHIGVIVPGMTTSVAGSLGDYDNHAKVMREAAEEAAGRGKRSRWSHSSATMRLPVSSVHQTPTWLRQVPRSSPAS